MITGEPTRVAIRDISAGLHDQYSTELPRVSLGSALPCAAQPGAQRSEKHCRIRGAAEVPAEAQQLEYSAVRIYKDPEVDLEEASEAGCSIRLAVAYYDYLGPEFVNRFCVPSKLNDELAA
jgi:hypothetical protein